MKHNQKKTMNPDNNKNVNSIVEPNTVTDSAVYSSSVQIGRVQTI